MDAHGDLAVTAAQKAEALNGQFSSVFTMDDGNLPDFTQRSRVNLSDINLSAERVRKFMCMLPNKFSRSPDGIPSAVLKVLSYEWCTPLYILFKMSIDSGTCPLQWKNADITPIYKKGDASQVSNYRPISILPAMCRLFERILADDINFHLYHNRLITDAQYGFVKGRSTELQLLNCGKMWINAIDSNKFVDTVYIDFSKAFDTVTHRKLLHKLINYGITGNILQWFSSFLCDRNSELRLVMYILVMPVCHQGYHKGHVPDHYYLFCMLMTCLIVIRVMTLWYVYLLTILNYLVYYPPLEIALNCKRV